jgi:serine/threonine protein kinase
MYILHSGSCLVQVESRGERHVLARLGPGDIVGEMSVLTGEPRMASVAAETDLQYWELPKDKFDAVAGKHPDLRLFLTEVVTQRFENSPITAERSIGKYVVERKIGKGGWSIVYAGRHKRLGLHVVVKMLKHDMAMEPSFLDTFGKEAEIIAQLNHPNIVKVYDIEELYRTVFIIMEHLDGLALSSILERYGVVSIPRTVNFLSQMLHGLAYAHKQGVMHRDMKPANIFVQPKDRIKILDFGLACQPGVEDHSIAGTAHYAPPEQIEGDPVDERADLYSMGIMAYEMLLGRRPYPEDDLARLMDLHVEEDIPDPAADMPDMPPVLREFIITCCRRPPDGRYASAWEALDAIRPLVRELGLLGRQEAPRRREIASMLMFYNQEQRPEVDELVEQFKRMAQNLGLDMRRADFREH